MTLTEFIQQDIQRHIEAGEQTPSRLTIAALSEHYRVSLTPVRAAIEQLVQDRYLEKLENGRLSVHQRWLAPGRRKTKLERPGRPVQLEDVVRRDVVRLSVCGETRYLREESAARKYGVGRTALRPILGRLSGQGFLKHVPRCGWQIRTLDERELQSYLQCREVLELKALDLARPRLERAMLDELLRGNQAPEKDAAAVFDNRLHAYWIKKSENTYIIEFFNAYGRFFTTLLEDLAPEAAVVAEVAEQHCRILEAVIDHRWPDARRELRRHIRDQAPIAKRAMEALSRQAMSDDASS